MNEDFIKQLSIDICRYYDTESIGNPIVDYNNVYDLIEQALIFYTVDEE